MEIETLLDAVIANWDQEGQGRQQGGSGHGEDKERGQLKDNNRVKARVVKGHRVDSEGIVSGQ